MIPPCSPRKKSPDLGHTDEPKWVCVPNMRGRMFSENNRWAEAVWSTARTHTEGGERIDPVWSVLMALPEALERFLDPEWVPSKRG